MKRLSIGFALALGILLGGCATKVDAPWVYPYSTVTRAQSFIRQGIPLRDFHIHLRGGMSVGKAFQRERASGITSA